MDRRRFIELVAGSAIATQLLGGRPSVAAENDYAFPRALMFRQSEVLAGQLPYEEWAERMKALDGIIGKVLAEEQFYDDRRAAYFNRFKLDNPDKLVIVHLNGRGRRPSYRPGRFFAGHWAYRQGTYLANEILADTTVLNLSSTQMFNLQVGRFNDRGDDICCTAVGADGKPDWTQAEQMQVLDIDKAGRAITVRRGVFGTAARSFSAGAYVAPHIVFGPWSNPSTDTTELIWAYNFSSLCPRDLLGKNAVDAVADDFAELFGPTGPLSAVDGLQLDVFAFAPGRRSQADLDADGLADGGMVDGIETYGLGMVEFTRALRERLGPDRLILTDGGPEARPDLSLVSGIEREGWPDPDDVSMTAWSSAVNLMRFWQGVQGRPTLNYPLYKFSQDISPKKPVFALARGAMASAALLDLSFATFISPNEPDGYTLSDALQPAKDVPEQPYSFSIFDELVDGAKQTLGWLGKPTGPMTCGVPGEAILALGSALPWASAVVESRDAVVSITESGLYLEPHPQPSIPSLERLVKATLPVPPILGGDIWVEAVVSGDGIEGYPATIGRNLKLSILDSPLLEQSSYFAEGRQAAIFCFSDIQPGPATLQLTVEGDTPFTLHELSVWDRPAAVYREFESGAVFLNASKRPFEYDLEALFGQQRFIRLSATEGQDPGANDGSILGPKLLLAASDALFVKKAS